MGCVIEIIFEIFFEATLEIITYLYRKIALWAYPEHVFGKKSQKRITNIVIKSFLISVICIIVGVIMMLCASSRGVILAGKLLTFIPLSLIGLQLIVGIIFKIITAIKK